MDGRYIQRHWWLYQGLKKRQELVRTRRLLDGRNVHQGSIRASLCFFPSRDIANAILQTHKKEVLFDATHAKPSPIQARPMAEQGERESQKLWHKVTDAIKRADQHTATDEKTFIEDRQRKEAAEHGGEASWQPRLFRRTGAGGHSGPGDEPDEENLDWVINAEM